MAEADAFPPAPAPVPMPVPPSKPATSGYFLFSSENRKQVQEEHPELKGVAAVAKELGRRWQALDPSQQQEYTDRAKAAQGTYQQDLAAFTAANPEWAAAEEERKARAARGDGLSLPVQKIKKIVMLDDDVKRISKEALHLVTKATEFFIAHYARLAFENTEGGNRKTINPADVVHQIREQATLEFLEASFKSEIELAGQPPPKVTRKRTAQDTLPEEQPSKMNKIETYFGKSDVDGQGAPTNGIPADHMQVDQGSLLPQAPYP